MSVQSGPSESQEIFSPRALYTAPEVCDTLKISYDQFKYYFKAKGLGQLTVVKLTRSRKTGLRFYGDELNAWVASNASRKRGTR